MDTIKDTIIFRIIFVIELFIIKLDHKIKYTSRQKMGHTFFRYYQTQPATCYLPNTNKRKKEFTYRYLVTSDKKTTAHNYLSTSLHGLQTCWYPDDLYINSLLSLYFITKPIITYCPLFLTIIKCHAWQFVYASRKYI